jgi:peptidyl-prolyl cis-trans isomerase B (cyclophilin B)
VTINGILNFENFDLHRKDSIMATKKPIVTFELNNGNKIIAELYPEIAPNTVNNYISLIKQGFYDGLTFHRVIPGFMIQGGCPDGTGMGGPGHHIKGEFTSNDFNNELTHSDGVLSMARSQSNDSAGSQFFIMHKNSPHLDGQYASFGKVIEGMEEVNRIAEVKSNYSDMPDEPQVMVKVIVDTLGEEYPEPETV